jgi:hypothetical protein
VSGTARRTGWLSACGEKEKGKGIHNFQNSKFLRNFLLEGWKDEHVPWIMGCMHKMNEMK